MSADESGSVFGKGSLVKVFIVGGLGFVLGVGVMSLLTPDEIDPALFESQAIEGRESEEKLPIRKVELLSGTPLLDQLREGGTIIYFRHFQTDHSKWHVDPIKARHGQLTDLEIWATCEDQRRLTEYGLYFSDSVGRAVRDLEIPIGRAISSPYCRAVRSLEGVVGRPPDEITLDLLHRGGDLSTDEMVRNLSRLLSDQPPTGSNTALFAHRPQMDEIGQAVEGQAFVFRPNTDGTVDLIATILPQEWILATVEEKHLGLASAEGGAYR